MKPRNGTFGFLCEIVRKSSPFGARSRPGRVGLEAEAAPQKLGPMDGLNMVIQLLLGGEGPGARRALLRGRGHGGRQEAAEVVVAQVVAQVLLVLADFSAEIAGLLFVLRGRLGGRRGHEVADDVGQAGLLGGLLDGGGL